MASRGAAARLAHVVAPQVHEHDVLSALLLICQQILLKRPVLLRSGAAPPRARQRPAAKPATESQSLLMSRATQKGTRINTPGRRRRRGGRMVPCCRPACAGGGAAGAWQQAGGAASCAPRAPRTGW